MANDWDRHFQKKDPYLLPFLDFMDEMRHRFFGSAMVPDILEIGAGQGGFAAKTGVTDVLDVSQSSLKLVKMQLPHLRTHHYEQLPLPFPDGRFQTIVCNDVLHHVKETIPLDAFYKEVFRVLKPDGVLLISDRSPAFINRVNGWINKTGRALYLALSPKRNTAGGPVELMMEPWDYEALFSCFTVVKQKKWRSVATFWSVGVGMFSSFILPQKLHASWFSFILRTSEALLPIFRSDLLLILVKKQEGEARLRRP